MDSAWDAWRKHVKTHMRVPDDEQTMRDTWEPKKLEELIERHKKVNASLKAKKQNTRFCMLVLVDDWADAGEKSDAQLDPRADKPLCARKAHWLRMLVVAT